MQDSNHPPLPEHFLRFEDTSGKPYVLENQLAHINQLHTFMRLVVYGTETHHNTVINRLGKPVMQVSNLGESLDKLGTYAALFVTGYQFHPLLVFFFNEYREHPIRDCRDFKAHMHGPGDRPVWQLFDDFVAAMRQKASATCLKKQVSDWESKTKKNYQRAKKLVSRLFQSYAKLMVIRLDLNHRARLFTAEEAQAYLTTAGHKQWRDMEAFEADMRITDFEPLRGRVAFETVQKDREHFFANTKGKPSLFEHLIGYIWRIEFSPEAGHHLHVALFFDGSKVHKHEWLAQEIGQYWANEITDGRGYPHNVNAEWKESDPRCGIGMINHHDHVKRKILEERVLAYLCKSTQIVQVLPYAGANTFGSSELPKLPSGLGRPRIKGVIPEELSAKAMRNSYPTSSSPFYDNNLPTHALEERQT